MLIPRIDQNNWTHAHLVQGELHAYISFGAQPGPGNETEELYFINLTEGHAEESPLLQERVFRSLDQALEEINGRYAHFDFKDLAETPGGCGSCSAH